MKHLVCLYLLTATGLFACHAASQPALTPTNTPIPVNITQIVNVTVIDVEKGLALPGYTVIIKDDLIEKLGASSEIGTIEGAQTLDGQGLYMIPGLVDAHVHFLDAPVFGRLMIANGVLLVRDTGMPAEYILPIRDELNQGKILGPEMIASGWVLDRNPPLIPSVSLGIANGEEGRAAVRKQAEAGVDMIKVYSTLDKDTFLAILDEAQKLGLKTFGHVPDSISIEEAAAAGLKSSEHFFGFDKLIARLLGAPVKYQYAGMGAEASYFMQLDSVNVEELNDVLKQLKESGLTVCPTVVTFKIGTRMSTFQAGDFERKEFISPQVMNVWNSLWASQTDLPDFIWQNWAKLVNKLNGIGIPLMVGTDLMVPGVFPGFAVHDEMAIWQEAGIPPADILRSATIVPIRFMGLDNRLGSLSVGKTASFVLLRANPLEDIRNTQQIAGVFLRGRYFNQADLDQLIEEAKQFAEQVTP